MVPLLTSLVLAAAPTPVLVELFTSEGCSSCPSAETALEWLERTQPVEGVEVIALALHVDYWNHLGWADPFSSAQFTARQEAYAKDTYTPQMIIDGDVAFVGSKTRALEALANQKDAPRVPVTVSAKLSGARLEISAAAKSSLPLWVAVTESGLTSEVTAGENRGRVLPHTAVVRSLQRVRGAGPLTITLEPGWKRAQLKVVAFVQEEGPGKVLGAAILKSVPGV